MEATGGVTTRNINATTRVQCEAKTRCSYERIRNVRDETTDDKTRSNDKRCSMQNKVGCCGWDNRTTNQTRWRGDKKGETGVRREDKCGERSGERGEVAAPRPKTRQEERGGKRRAPEDDFWLLVGVVKKHGESRFLHRNT